MFAPLPIRQRWLHTCYQYGTLVFVKARGEIINGPVLRVFRQKLLKTTTAQAAALIGVSHGLWSQWELGGRGISDVNLSLLVDLFGLESPAPLLASTAHEAEVEAERQRARRTKAGAAA